VLKILLMAVTNVGLYQQIVNTGIFVESSFTSSVWTSYIDKNFKVQQVRLVRGGILYWEMRVMLHTQRSTNYTPAKIRRNLFL
jgi:hypothetical protein